MVGHLKSYTTASESSSISMISSKIDHLFLTVMTQGSKARKSWSVENLIHHHDNRGCFAHLSIATIY